MTDDSDRAYARLAELVRERRRELRLTQEDVRARNGPSTATMRLIEAGQPTEYRRGTTDQLEDALEWQRGSVDAVLSGGDPMTQRKTVSAPDQDGGVLLSLPPDAFEGLSPADREEAISAAKATLLERAREIRRRLDQ